MTRTRKTDFLAEGLGWFSVGLGLAEITAPRGLARLIGVELDGGGGRTLMRALGAREIAAGLGILSGRRRAAWMWSRVLGDAMDLALLGSAMSSSRNQRGRVSAATLAVVGVTAVDVLAAARLSREAAGAGSAERGIEVVKEIAVGRTQGHPPPQGGGVRQGRAEGMSG